MVSEQTRSTPKRGEMNKTFFIRLRRAKGDQADAWELRRAIEYLGGVETRWGFEFPSAARRAVALEVVGDKYGARYFQTEDRQGHDGRPRLLVADSDPTVIDIYQTLFTREGYDVETTTNGLECLSRTRQCMPDVLVLDYELPCDADGVLARLREEYPLTPIGVVLITCDYSVEDVADELLAPVVGCLRKPFRLRELLEIVRSIRQQQPARDAVGLLSS